MKKLVRKTLTGRSLSESRIRNLSAIAAPPDSEIDFSDIPPLTEKFWANAVRNPYYRPVKQQVLREAMIGDIPKG